jgi:transposase
MPREVFGKDPLPGTLVVDRYHAYNKAPCFLQYGYAHLLRDVEDVEKEFPDDAEVKHFVGTFASLLASTMNLQSLPISDDQDYKQAKEIKGQILESVHDSAHHLAIRRIQETFHENDERLYRWADGRQTPPDNHLAERDLRPTVIARKVSFGSQSETGANTRSILMTMVHTLRKHLSNPCATLKTAFDPSLFSFPIIRLEKTPEFLGSTKARRNCRQRAVEVSLSQYHKNLRVKLGHYYSWPCERNLSFG